jgi:hypothetical protein
MFAFKHSGLVSRPNTEHTSKPKQLHVYTRTNNCITGCRKQLGLFFRLGDTYWHTCTYTHTNAQTCTYTYTNNTHTRIRIHKYIHTHTHTHTYVTLHMHAHKHIHTCGRTYIRRLPTYTHTSAQTVYIYMTYIHSHTHILHAYIYKHTYIHTHTQMRTYIHYITHACIQTYTYMRARTHTYVDCLHTHTHYIVTHSLHDRLIDVNKLNSYFGFAVRHFTKRYKGSMHANKQGGKTSFRDWLSCTMWNVIPRHSLNETFHPPMICWSINCLESCRCRH